MRAIAAALLLCQAVPVAAQEAFQGTYIVQQGGAEVGRETVTIKPGRARGAPGSTLTVEARYPAARLQISAKLQRTPDRVLDAFQLDVQSPEGVSAILAAGAGARLIVRTVAKGAEAGRELPGGPDVVLLDDNVYALYQAVADAATEGGTSLSAVFARTGRRARFSAHRQGAAVRLSGEIAGTLTIDGRGHLERLEFPGSSTVVVRQAE
jgi:hypothetical protein